MRCAKSLMLWYLQKTQEYWWYVEAFCKRPAPSAQRPAPATPAIQPFFLLSRLHKPSIFTLGIATPPGGAYIWYNNNPK